MIKEKNYYSVVDMIQLDKEREFIPLTVDGMFKGIFKKDLNLLKDFVLSQIGLEIEDGMCKIELLDLELVKDKVDEYQKTVDIYVTISKINIVIQIDKDYFDNVDKKNFVFNGELYTLLYERDDANNIDNSFDIEINLDDTDDKDYKKMKDGVDRIVFLGLNTGIIYDNYRLTYIKYLKYFRDLYYDRETKLDRSNIWLVLFASKSFLEMYNILGKLFDDNRREEFIRNVIDIIDDKKVIDDCKFKKIKWIC